MFGFSSDVCESVCVRACARARVRVDTQLGGDRRRCLQGLQGNGVCRVCRVIADDICQVRKCSLYREHVFFLSSSWVGK